jgi:hypothetical protein
VEDGDRPGSPHEAVTEENIEKCEMWFEKIEGWVFEQWLKKLISTG